MPWEPIAPLNSELHAYNAPEFSKFVELWTDQREEVARKEQFEEFNRRLNREFAIETGLIEGLYTLDRGITQTLIEQGLNAALIPHSSASGNDAKQVIALIRDQEASLQSLRDFVEKKRNLTPSYIKEIHAQLTQHQDTTEAQTSDGRIVKVSLKKGDWKDQPNNPTRADGVVHYYSPPEQVASEMDRLCSLAADYAKGNVPVQVQAAWLHHRFTQIHPFQDGNGRVARALATLILLRGFLFPFTVKTENRSQYISTLESADDGDLIPLIDLITKQQLSSLRRAVSVAEQVDKAAAGADALIKAAAQRLKARFERSQKEYTLVYDREAVVFDEIKRRLTEICRELNKDLKDLGVNAFVVESTPDKAHYYTRDVVVAAKEFGYFADFRAHHQWMFLRIEEKQASESVTSFDLLFSIHPVSRDFSGVLAVTSVGARKTDDDEGGRDIKVLTDAPFNFYFNQSNEDILSGLTKWLDGSIRNGLAEWQRGL